MRSLFFLLTLTVFTSCAIGDDIVDDYVQPVLRLTNPVDTIAFGTTYQFEHSFVNNVGQPETVTAGWTSSDTDVLRITDSGLATAITAGDVVVTASFTDEFGETASVEEAVAVGTETVIEEVVMRRTGSVRTTSSYPLRGDFELTEEMDGSLRLTFGDDYSADDGLPGLFVYLSNNPNSIGGALEIGAVEVFSGAHEYTITGVELEEYAYVLYFCKPFNVKVGDGEILE